MVFLTSNLGATEMSSLVSPKLGFHAPPSEEAGRGAKLSAQVSRTGIAAARRKFTPEFINRLDKIVVFKSLGNEELRKILDIELEMVQQRIRTTAASNPFLIDVTDSARNFLLTEGTDFQYGARPLKRAIERLLVQPLSNLMATSQIHHGDRIRVTHKDGSPVLVFFREAGAFEARELAHRVGASSRQSALTSARSIRANETVGPYEIPYWWAIDPS
jgi:ATP-dependent Clp protease ATP-binding subunit ClpA